MPCILVVDDYPPNRRLLEAWLGKLGFEVDSAQNGAEAVAKIMQGNGQHALVLMDYNMPVMDGFEATRRLRAWEADQPGRHLPVIAVTTGGDEVTAQSCAAAGMDDLMIKPVNFVLLEQMILRLLAD